MIREKTMETEAILELTSSIQNLDHTMSRVQILLILLIIIMAGLTWFINRQLTRKTGIESITFDSDFADELFSSDQVDELLSYSHKHEAKSPNDVDVNWYLGIAYYYKGDFQRSKLYFEKTIQLNPNWEAGASGYIDKIDSTSFSSGNNHIQ